MSNYLNPLTETVFFSACCVVTHSFVCILCIVFRNARQCLLYVFVVGYKNKFFLLQAGFLWMNRLREHCLRIVLENYFANTSS